MRVYLLLCLAFCAIISARAPAHARKLDGVGITNAQFYDLIKDYATEDIESEEDGENSQEKDGDDDVITLPGGPDDQLDVEYLANKLGMTEIDDDNADLMDNDEVSNGLGWKHHHHRHHHHKKHRHHHHHHRRHRHRTKVTCGRSRNSYKCCLSRTFRFHRSRGRKRFHLNACIKVVYLRRWHGFEISFTINGHRLLHKEFSLRTGISLCYHVPPIRLVKVCLNVYNINLHRRSMCVRLTGKVLFIKVHLKIACFHIGHHRLDDMIGSDSQSDYFRLAADELMKNTDIPGHQELGDILIDATGDLDSQGDLALQDALVDDVESSNTDPVPSDASVDDVDSSNSDSFDPLE